MTSRTLRKVAAAALLLGAVHVDLRAGTPEERGQAIAATCATCHHPDNTAIPPIEGRPAAELVSRLHELVQDPNAIVMARLAAGLTESDIDAVAATLSRSKQP